MQKINIAKRLFPWSSLAVATVVTLLSSAQVHAEYFGFPTGRSANIASLPSTSIEAGVLTGDISGSSYLGFGARFNFRPSDVVMLYGDIVQAEVDDFDGLTYGAGLFYQIKGISKKSDFALKLSFHTASLKESGTNDKASGNILSIEGVFSGQKIGESNLRWYTNFGLHKFDIDDSYNYDETELGFGGGVFTETSFGEFYAGIDLIDELTFGGGVRLHLQ